ncbi:MAG: 2-amino-4-hydroxy-6-hydroxymethyldihydropteridine diphosphokinase [Candidatus Tectomicrobia bacterium]|nr:2-amino-4-hydroxy-6-hydroxymethyldihydropteridine diphosphokinase [Candidatus Tectomicrobia bacterium]
METAAGDVYIGLGSNLGDAAANCRRAVRELGRSEGIRVLRASRWYRSEPVGGVEQDWFVNGVVAARTTLEPLALLAALKELERRLGRVPGPRWGPRRIDLDLLLYGERLIDTAELIVPHAALHERRFVLLPLCDLAPDLTHPLLGLPMRELLRRLPAGQVVELLTEA